MMEETEKQDAALLRFDGVDLSGEGYDGDLREVSFALRAGELMMIRGVRRRMNLPLLDAVQGLLEPVRGVVEYEGMDWRKMPLYNQSKARGAMGRIYARHDAWLSNLDIDENVTLRVRHHAGRAPDEVYAEARELAERMGLEKLPGVRPPLVSRENLQKSQCVRALLGGTRLILAEYPCQFMSEETQQCLLDLIMERRDAGSAVIWLTLNEGLWDTMRAKADCWCLEDDNLLKAED
jgi:ABC-type ATPase involved in cell division